ncbi:MAG: hypothetical protein ACRD2C_26145 [Acidimicrobiales bacterium]
MDRRQFLAGAVALPTTASLDGLDSIAPTTPPTRVGATEIARIRDTAAGVKRGDLRWGGGFGFDAALVETRRARELLEARCPERLRGDLLVGVGWLASNAGFMAFDIERYRDAARLWNVAQRCADEAVNWSLQARVLGSMARQSIWLDHPADGVALLDRALMDERGELVPTEHAMLWALKSRAHADLGDATAAETAVGTADEWLAQTVPGECDDRPWVAHYSQAHHWGDTGVAWERLAVSGHGPQAVANADGRYRGAADGHGTDAARSHVLTLVSLARLNTVAGDLDVGVAVGHQALDASEQVRSARVREDLVGLYEATAAHATRGDVGDLRDQIATTLLAA